MKQPRGFIHLNYADHVCKLKKTLYGLKQAPRALFHSLGSFPLSYGFVCSNVDPSMFILRTGSHILVLLLCVDDIILTYSSSSLLHSFMSTLSNQFAMKDLGTFTISLAYRSSVIPRVFFFPSINTLILSFINFIFILLILLPLLLLLIPFYP